MDKVSLCYSIDSKHRAHSSLFRFLRVGNRIFRVAGLLTLRLGFGNQAVSMHITSMNDKGSSLLF